MQLGRLGLLDALRRTYGTIHVPRLVYVEVVEEGIRLGEVDASLVRRAVEEGWMRVHDIDRREALAIADSHGLHVGEGEVKALAGRLAARLVLMDERDGREAAREQGFLVRGTIGALIQAVRRGTIGSDRAREALEEMLARPKEFWIDPKIIRGALTRLERP
ncbi:TPA: DUF3368 domain-containing protein [Candidatus Bathyarchaeota archaeon]|nr:DUF3368 domain-containing protein [Candidatus Bathyarchaeota archaeon]